MPPSYGMHSNYEVCQRILYDTKIEGTVIIYEQYLWTEYLFIRNRKKLANIPNFVNNSFVFQLDYEVILMFKHFSIYCDSVWINVPLYPL